MDPNKFKVFLLKYKTNIQRILELLILLGFVYQGVSTYFYPLPYISWPQFHLFIIPLIELWGLSNIFSIYYRSEEQKSSTLIRDLVFWFAFFNLGILWLLFRYYNKESIVQYNSAQLALNLITLSIYFFAITALITFSIYVKNSKKIYLFENHYPDKNEYHQVTIFRMWQVKQESRDQAIYLLILFIIGLILRLYNLDGFPPYVDEYIHTHRAAEMIKGIDLGWDRAYLTVTIPVYLSYLIFGVSLWSGRLPMVIINMLAIFPVFSLGKKLNRPIAYISAALFVFSPWTIAVSRTVRDYAVIPVFFYLAAVYLLDLLDWEKYSIKKYLNHHKFKIVFLGLLLIYILVDRASVMKIVIALYGIFGGLMLLKILKQKPSTRKIVFGLIGSISIIALLIQQTRLINRYLRDGNIISRIVFRYWNSLIQSEIQQWYYWPVIGYFIIFLVGYLSLRAIVSEYNKKYFVVLFYYLAFAANLIYLTVFLVNPRVPARTRYGILLVYWYLPVVAVALYYIYLFGKRFVPRKAHFLIPIILVVSFTNYQGIWRAISYRGGGSSRITGESHYLVSSARDYLIEHLTSQDVLVSDIVHRYDEISGNEFQVSEIISLIGLVFPQQSNPLVVIDQYPQGWVASSLLISPARHELPLENFVYEGKQVFFHGMYGEIVIWQWLVQTPISQ